MAMLQKGADKFWSTGLIYLLGSVVGSSALLFRSGYFYYEQHKRLNVTYLHYSVNLSHQVMDNERINMKRIIR